MYKTLVDISTALFILSVFFAAAAAYIYFHFDMRGYRVLVSNDVENRFRAKKEEKKNEDRQKDKKDKDKEARPETEEETPRKTTVTVPEEKEGQNRSKKPKFVMRTVSESDAIRKLPESGDNAKADENLPQDAVQKSAEKDVPDTADIPRAEADGVTKLQDGSGNTVYLKSEDRKELPVFEEDDPLWAPAAGKFRTTGSTMIIHTDRTISQILSSLD